MVLQRRLDFRLLRQPIVGALASCRTSRHSLEERVRNRLETRFPKSSRKARENCGESTAPIRGGRCIRRHLWDCVSGRPTATFSPVIRRTRSTSLKSFKWAISRLKEFLSVQRVATHQRAVFFSGDLSASVASHKPQACQAPPLHSWMRIDSISRIVL